MSQRSRWVLLGFACAGAASTVMLSAEAVEVRGTVNAPPMKLLPSGLGYTRTPVAQASSDLRQTKVATAVFLKVRESLPLPAPTAKWPLKIAGLRLDPSVVACAVDETIEITNHDRTPVTVQMGQETLQPVGPGGTLTYLCQQAGTHNIRVQEWPHIRGTLFIGEVGVTGSPGPDGRFALNAPQGTYDLVVVSSDGLLAQLPVTVAKADVDLGSIAPTPAAAAGAASAPAEAPGAKAEPPKPEPVKAEPPKVEPKPRPKPPPPAPAEGAPVKVEPKPKPAPKPPPPAAPEDVIKLEP